MLKQAFCCVLVWIVAGSVWAQDFERQKLQNWHQFRGPQDTGVAPMGNPPIEWSETKNIKWKVPIPGSGSASPIVWGNRIFILTAVKTDRTAESADRTTSTSNATVRQVVYSPNELLAQRDENRPRATASAAIAVVAKDAVALADEAAAGSGSRLHRTIINSS